MSRSLLKKRRDKENDSSNKSSTKAQFSWKKENNLWKDEESLFKDQIREVLAKFDSIDDEIWGKIIYMEKNQRIAKAYARSSLNENDSIIRINNSASGFDGINMGLSGFDSPSRDNFILEALAHIGEGIEIIMEESGNIIVQNFAECRIFLQSWNSTGTGNQINPTMTIKWMLPGERETLFDMSVYLDKIDSQMTLEVPDRRHLELETLSIIGFGRETRVLLDTPSWLIIINIVALDILKTKLPHKFQRKSQRRPVSDVFSLSPLSPFVTISASPSPRDSGSSSSSTIESQQSTSTNRLHPNRLLPSIYWPEIKSRSTEPSPSEFSSASLTYKDRSRSWTSLTSQRRHSDLTRLPTPDYDKPESINGSNKVWQPESRSHLVCPIDHHAQFSSAKGSSLRSLTRETINGFPLDHRSSSYHDIMTDTCHNNWTKPVINQLSSNQRSKSSIMLKRLEKLNLWSE